MSLASRKKASFVSLMVQRKDVEREAGEAGASLVSCVWIGVTAFYSEGPDHGWIASWESSIYQEISSFLIRGDNGTCLAKYKGSEKSARQKGEFLPSQNCRSAQIAWASGETGSGSHGLLFVLVGFRDLRFSVGDERSSSCSVKVPASTIFP